jgi:hypothetical protein
MTVNERQVGGAHYGGVDFQHWDWAVTNNLGYLEGVLTKYISRWRRKAGRQDLEKAAHYADKLIEVHNQGWARLVNIIPERRKVRFVQGLDEMTSLYRLNFTEREIFRLAVEYKTLTDLRRVRALIDEIEVPPLPTEFLRRER